MPDPAKKVIRKRKERYFHGRPKDYQMDIQFQTKGNRYFIKASGRQEDLDTKDTSPPNAWKTLYVDKQVRVYGGVATRDTDYTVNGENVFFMKFKDGRRIRIYPNDLPERRIRAINKVLKEHNNIVNQS